MKRHTRGDKTSCQSKELFTMRFRLLTESAIAILKLFRHRHAVQTGAGEHNEKDDRAKGKKHCFGHVTYLSGRRG